MLLLLCGFLERNASQVAGALVKTLLELSLTMKVPLVNGLCFSHVSEGDSNVLSGKLARAAINMAAMREGRKESYSGMLNEYILYMLLYLVCRFVLGVCFFVCVFVCFLCFFACVCVFVCVFLAFVGWSVWCFLAFVFGLGLVLFFGFFGVVCSGGF